MIPLILQRYPFEGYLIIAVDDSNYLYAEQLADLVAEYEGRISWFVCHRTTYEHGHQPLEEGISDRESMAAQLAAEGHDIGCHSWSHSKLNDYDAMNISYKGTGDCVLAISNKTLTLDALDDQYDFSMGLSGKSCQDIIDAVSGAGDGNGYQITMVTFEGTIQQFGHAQATSLADVYSQSIAAQYTMLFDFDRWKVDEIDDTIEWIEAINGMPQGYSVTTFAAPYNEYDAQWLSYIRTKFSAARSGGSSFYSTKANSIDLHEIGFLESEILFGPTGTYTDDQIRERGRWLGERLSMHGGVVCIFAHNEDETGIDEWSLILEEIMENYPKVQLVSLRQFYEIVVSSGSGWTKSSNIWERNIEADFDFHLTSGSPCIDAGENMGLEHDTEGCQIPQGNAVDIGAYEYDCQSYVQTTTTVPATTTVYPGCPIAFMLENDKEKINIIRKFRNEVLLKTQDGRRLVQFYYKHIPEIVRIMELNPDIENRAQSLLNILLQELNSGKKIDLGPEMIIRITDLCDDVSAKASNELGRFAQEIKKGVVNGLIFAEQ